MGPSHSSNPSFAMSSTMSDITDLPYPKGELTQAPPAAPLRKPSVLSQKNKRETVSDNTISTLEKAPSISEAEKRRKHESYMLSGSVFLVTEYGQVLNLPTPSDSPADPLGWKRWQRVGAFLALAWFATVAVAVAQAAGSLLRVMFIEFDSEGVPGWQIEWLVTAPILFMGIGAFVWIPLSIGVGRRPSALLASLVLTAASLGAGYSKSFPQLLTCVCFLGLGAGFAVQTAFLIAIDITFIHERPKAIALLWSFAGFFGTGAVAIVPYISNGGNSWRPYYQYWSLPAMAATALIFFLLPETYFKRPTVAFDGLIVLQSATEKLTVFKDVEADSDIYRDLPPLPNHQGLLGRLNFWRSPFASWTSMGRCYLQIGFCFLNPLIFWIVIAASVNFISSTYINTTFPRVLGSEPYDLSAEETTLLNLAAALGGLLAYPIGVLPIEKIMDRLARSNNGVREAEHYLIGLVLPVTTGALSTVIYGCAVDDGLHLTAYYFANGFNGFSCVALSISTTMWVTEAFPRWAAPALAVLSGGSYILSFCMTLSIWPWIDAHGFRLVGIEIAVLQIVTGLIAVPIIFFGKSARQAIHGRWADERGGALRPL